MGVWVKKRCEKLRIRSFGAGIFPFKCPCPETFRSNSLILRSREHHIQPFKVNWLEHPAVKTDIEVILLDSQSHRKVTPARVLRWGSAPGK